MPCSALNIDVMDLSGEQHLDVNHDIFKQRLSKVGTPVADLEKGKVGEKSEKGAIVMVDGCGSCYGAETNTRKCCNSCRELEDAYKDKRWNVREVREVPICVNNIHKIEGEFKKQYSEKEGCNIHGHVETSKVAGNFHFAPGRAYQQGSMHFHDLAPFKGAKFDVSHTIHRLAFGVEYPGQVNPLDGAVHQLEHPNGMYQYYLKVVPTLYTSTKGEQMRTNQFSVTEHFKENPPGQPQAVVPGVFFFYDFSPLLVDVVEGTTSFLHFITNLLAILGGVFTVAGMVDGVVYHGQKALQKKMELGKLS